MVLARDVRPAGLPTVAEPREVLRLNERRMPQPAPRRGRVQSQFTGRVAQAPVQFQMPERSPAGPVDPQAPQILRTAAQDGVEAYRDFVKNIATRDKENVTAVRAVLAKTAGQMPPIRDRYRPVTLVDGRRVESPQNSSPEKEQELERLQPGSLRFPKLGGHTTGDTQSPHGELLSLDAPEEEEIDSGHASHPELQFLDGEFEEINPNHALQPELLSPDGTNGNNMDDNHTHRPRLLLEASSREGIQYNSGDDIDGNPVIDDVINALAALGTDGSALPRAVSAHYARHQRSGGQAQQRSGSTNSAAIVSPDTPDVAGDGIVSAATTVDPADGTGNKGKGKDERGRATFAEQQAGRASEALGRRQAESQTQPYADLDSWMENIVAGNPGTEQVDRSQGQADVSETHEPALGGPHAGKDAEEEEDNLIDL